MTFVETLMVVFIFALIIVTTMGIAAAYLRNRSSIKKYQQNVEEMSLSINDMAKRIRMSNCDEVSDCSFGSGKITMKPNDGGSTLVYEFDASDHVLKKGTSVIMEDVDGNFSTQNSDIPDHIPRITITMWKHSMPQAVIQTTISMRSGYGAPQ